MGNENAKPMKPLLEAFERGDTGAIEEFLNKSGSNINIQDRGGRTCLFYACVKGYTKIVARMIQDERVDMNLCDKQGRTPFFVACHMGHTEVVRVMMESKRVDLNKGDREGSTPFASACLQGHARVVDCIIKKLDEEQLKRKEMKTGIRRSDDGEVGDVKTLLDVNKGDSQGKTPFSIVCTLRRKALLEKMIEDKRFDVNKKDNNGLSPFWISCISGDFATAKRLMKSDRVNVNQTAYKCGLTPFMLMFIYYEYNEEGRKDMIYHMVKDRRVTLDNRTTQDYRRYSRENSTPKGSGVIELAKSFNYDRAADYFLTIRRTLEGIELEKLNKNELAEAFLTSCAEGSLKLVQKITKMIKSKRSKQQK